MIETGRRVTGSRECRLCRRHRHLNELRSGHVKPGVICSVRNADESTLDMPQWDREGVWRLRNVFAMYVKFSRERWPGVARTKSPRPELTRTSRRPQKA